MSPRTSTDAVKPYGVDGSPPMERTQVLAGDVPIAVYGLGKIGLPVAAVLAERTGAVTGVDIDRSVVARVADGQPPFDHEPELAALLSDVVPDRLATTADVEAAASEAAVHVIVVPVPIDDGQADLAALRDVTTAIGGGLAPGDLVVVESTVPPGTVDEVVGPLLAKTSALERSAFGVASCPERTSSGRAVSDVRGSYPRIVGGTDAGATAAAETFYDAVIETSVRPVADARTAEAVKLFEGVYRDVNIALANELARAFDDTPIDVRDAIDAANTLPFCDIHEPGVGVGGHCIPWYPYFLMQAAAGPTPLTATGRTVNDAMPRLVADRTLEALRRRGIEPEECHVAVLGYAYRPGIPEAAATPAAPLKRRLEEAGVEVSIVDPVLERHGHEVELLGMDELATAAPDAVILVTAHEAFEELEYGALGEPLVIDGRDAVPPGVARTYTVGRGWHREDQ